MSRSGSTRALGRAGGVSEARVGGERALDPRGDAGVADRARSRSRTRLAWCLSA